MKWDESQKQPDGSWVRKAYFQDHVSGQELTDFSAKRELELRQFGSWELMGKAFWMRGFHGERNSYLVQIHRINGEQLRKYRHFSVVGKDKAIEVLLREAS
jgi:hypothetical protein